MSQVHEKLQNLPSAQEMEPSLPGPQGLVTSSFSLKKKKNKKQLVITCAVATIALVISIVAQKIISARNAAKAVKPAPVEPSLVIRGLIQQERFQDAIPVLEEVLKTRAEDPGATITLALAHKKNGNPTAARELLEIALERRPDDAVAHNNVGRMYASENNFESAITSYQKAIEARPEYAEAYFNSATAYEATKQWERSVQHYERFLALDNEHKDHHESIKQRLRRLRAFQTYTANNVPKSAPKSQSKDTPNNEAPR